MKGDSGRTRERDRKQVESEGDQEGILILALSQRLRGNIFPSYDEKWQEGGGGRRAGEMGRKEQRTGSTGYGRKRRSERDGRVKTVGRDNRRKEKSDGGV